MSTVKSFSVGEGDTFYIQHNSDNFTTIDCCLYNKNGVKDAIIKEIKDKSKDKGISRFIGAPDKPCGEDVRMLPHNCRQTIHEERDVSDSFHLCSEAFDL